MAETCIFCKIVAGDIPAFKVYETEHVLAFLDINPIEKGHTLVIPKMHCETLMATPDGTASRTIEAVRRIAGAMMATGADGVNVLQSNGVAAGQEVPHLHFHVIPRQTSGQPRNWISGGVRYAQESERTAWARRLQEGAEGMAPTP